VSFNSQQVSVATESGVNPKNPQLLDTNWLEVWYQPKIDSQTLSNNGAEALLRMRHTLLGLMLPAHFIPEDGDPRFQAPSQFVIDQAIADWHDWFAQEPSIFRSIFPSRFCAIRRAWNTCIRGCRLRRPSTG